MISEYKEYSCDEWNIKNVHVLSHQKNVRLSLTGLVTDGIWRRHRFLVAQEYAGAPLKHSSQGYSRGFSVNVEVQAKKSPSGSPCHSWDSFPLYRRCVVAPRPCWWQWRKCPSLPGNSEAGQGVLGGKWWRCAVRWWSCCWRWRSGHTELLEWPRNPESDAPYPHTAPWETKQQEVNITCILVYNIT